MAETWFGDVRVEEMEGHVALVEIRRGPENFFDVALIAALADAFEHLDQAQDHRVAVLASEGRHFCAGANFPAATAADRSRLFVDDGASPLYAEAVRLFAAQKHVVAAIQGAAIGGGLGLAMVADFRIGCAESRFAANFVKLGITPGFGLTHTLPRVLGVQTAQDLFYTGRRVGGEEALRLGLLDQLVPQERLRGSAIAFARDIAANAPLALLALRAAMRGDLAAAVRAATDQENADQARLVKTADHLEGVRAVSERRPGRFTGR